MALPNRSTRRHLVVASTAVLRKRARPLTFVGFRVGDRWTDLRAEGSLKVDSPGRESHRPARRSRGRTSRTSSGRLYGAPARDESFKAAESKDAVDGTHYAEWKWSASTTTSDRMLALADRRCRCRPDERCGDRP